MGDVPTASVISNETAEEITSPATAQSYMSRLSAGAYERLRKWALFRQPNYWYIFFNGLQIVTCIIVFIIGFNESGVNKLGQLLDIHPGLSLAREVPAMDRARRILGKADPDGLHEVPEQDIVRARAKYFEVMDGFIDHGTIPVDALPLNSLALGLIHRLFPSALILRCIRHPCEAVLSTFVKPYGLNAVTCHFDRLERTATTIMATTAVSHQIEAALSMTVHPLRYEEFMADPQSTLSAIAQGLGLTPDIPADLPAQSPLDQWPKYRAEMSRWLDPLLRLAEQLGYPAK